MSAWRITPNISSTPGARNVDKPSIDDRVAGQREHGFGFLARGRFPAPRAGRDGDAASAACAVNKPSNTALAIRVVFFI